MTLDPNGQSASGSAPAEAPAQPNEADIQALVDAAVQDATEKRVRGLQSAYERQLAGLREELQAAKSDPDRYEADTSSRLEAELAAARREADALRVARQYPEVFPAYEAILSAKSPVEQLDILQAFVQEHQSSTPASAPAQAQAAAPAAPASVPAPPPVDPNRPVLQGQAPPSTSPDGMDQRLADQIIDSVGGSWPRF